jgi:hypothetical protein
VDPRTGTPTRAIWLGVAIAFALGVPGVDNDQVLGALFSMTATGLYSSYMIPVLLRVTISRDTFIPAEFNLGRWSILVGWIAALWALFMLVVLCLPQEQPVTLDNLNYSPVALGCILAYACASWMLSARKWFRLLHCIQSTSTNTLTSLPSFASGTTVKELLAAGNAHDESDEENEGEHNSDVNSNVYSHSNGNGNGNERDTSMPLPYTGVSIFDSANVPGDVTDHDPDHIHSHGHDPLAANHCWDDQHTALLSSSSPLPSTPLGDGFSMISVSAKSAKQRATNIIASLLGNSGSCRLKSKVDSENDPTYFDVEACFKQVEVEVEGRDVDPVSTKTTSQRTSSTGVRSRSAKGAPQPPSKASLLLSTNIPPNEKEEGGFYMQGI